MARLGEAIYETVRISGKGDAVDRWKAHLSALRERTEKLNAYRFVSLHYRNSLGTDLTVRLPEDVLRKLIYISEAEGRTPNNHILMLLRNNIQYF